MHSLNNCKGRTAHAVVWEPSAALNASHLSYICVFPSYSIVYKKLSFILTDKCVALLAESILKLKNVTHAIYLVVHSYYDISTVLRC